MKKSKAKRAKGKAAAKDLRVGKRSGDAVKGGSDHERQGQRGRDTWRFRWRGESDPGLHLDDRGLAYPPAS